MSGTNHLAYFLYALAGLQLLILVMFTFLAREYKYKDEYDDDDIALAINQRYPEAEFLIPSFGGDETFEDSIND